MYGKYCADAVEAAPINGKAAIKPFANNFVCFFGLCVGVSSIERVTGVEFARGLKQITHDIFLFFLFG